MPGGGGGGACGFWGGGAGLQFWWCEGDVCGSHLQLSALMASTPLGVGVGADKKRQSPRNTQKDNPGRHGYLRRIEAGAQAQGRGAGGGGGGGSVTRDPLVRGIPRAQIRAIDRAVMCCNLSTDRCHYWRPVGV